MNQKIPTKIAAYIEKRADGRWLKSNIQKTYKSVVVVPAIKEFENLPSLLQSLAKNEASAKDSSLILFVINNAKSSPTDVIENNLNSMSLLEEYRSRSNQYGLNIEFVDASSKGSELPDKDAGVGLARKIGIDQALLYFDYSVDGNSIVCLDSDCEVDRNYLSEIQRVTEKGFNAGVVRYAHSADNAAIINYEIFLRYYVLGLKLANSAYAYHSIGSCIVMDPELYVKIGGMNKKKAGEDFYFLEKAAKQNTIKSIDGTTVYPSSRKSWRVPFGTGQRMTRFYEKVRDEYVLYEPSLFVVLQKFLKLYNTEDKIDQEELLKGIRTISEPLYQFLIENNFVDAQQKIIDNSKTDSQLNHQKNIWFDSFRTLKLIHYLRDNGYPEKPMFTALNEIFDMLGIEYFERHTSSQLPSSEKQIEYLNLLRKLT